MRSSACFLLLSSLVACGAGPRMLAPADLSNSSQVLEATNRSRASGMLADESFTLGSYKIAAVDRSAVSRSGFSVGNYGRAKTTTGYTYELHGTATYQGACGSEARQKSVGLSSNSGVDWNSTEITCECKSEKGSAHLTLKGEREATGGELTLASATYQLTPVKETDTTSYASGPAGFRVDDNGQSLAAVETLYPGRIWLKSNTPPDAAEPLSCVLVGLMLYVPPREKF